MPGDPEANPHSEEMFTAHYPNPIDLKAIEFSASHYLSHKTKDFTPSSAAAIGALLRDFRLDRRMDHKRRFHSTRHPPWDARPLSYITVEEDVPLLSKEVNRLAIYSKSYKTSTTVKLGIVCCSTNAIIHTSQLNLSENTTPYYLHYNAPIW